MTGPLDEEDAAREEHAARLAASPMLQCPAVSDAHSLAVAVRWADRHPAARVFAVKHAARLGLTASLPGWPEIAQTAVNVQKVNSGSAGPPPGSPRPAPWSTWPPEPR